MEILNLTEFYQRTIEDYKLIREQKTKDPGHREALINSLALRILGTLLMVTAVALVLTGIGLISLASLGSLPILIVAVASCIFGYDCAVIGHKQSQLLKETVAAANPAAPSLFSFAGITTAVTSFVVGTAASEDPVAPPPHASGTSKAYLKGTIVAEWLYDYLTQTPPRQA